ncbi:MAG: NAD(P)/FAD-dependent oxidoreductase, partial [Anaerolineae bacterium]|nr:NAD(P)/FAD-dependent oxidoreductase [Anaerolineae bacterium]
MRKRNQVRKKVIVIGAGMSGLTAAAYLAKAGYPVTLYEQAGEIGGVTATLREAGYAWDLGPLLIEGLAPDERGGHILKDLGIAGQVGLKMDSRGYTFPDFDLWRPATYEGPNWRRERLKTLFPAERDAIDAYYTFYNRMLNVVTLNARADVAREPRKSLLKMQLWRAYNLVKQREAWSAQQLMDHYFVDQRLKAIFTSILADFVARPSRFPALAVPMLNAENSFDQRIPRRLSSAGKRPSYQFVLNGCGTLVKALGAALRQNGARVYTHATVEKILVEGDRVKGVELAGGHIELADVVVATGGARETFLGLVGREYLTADFAYLVDELELMESVLMV